MSICVEHGQDHNNVGLGSKIDSVRETPEQRPADTGSKVLVFQWTVYNPVVGGTKLVKEL